VVVLIIAVYIWPVSKPSFEELYAGVDQNVVNSLVTFRTVHAIETVDVKNVVWEHVVMGQGEDTIVFLHGMTVAYDIWR
jgi:hypothetical protein